MATEYALTLAGGTPLEQVAERATPDSRDRPTGAGPLLHADLRERWGFELTIRSGRSRYVSARGDSGWWEWEPAPYVALTFRMDDSDDIHSQILAMLPIIRRVLSTGSEDAALTLNGDVLLLTRLDNEMLKHHSPDWWGHYPGADSLIRG
jgi:hypothetical protein